MNKFKPYITRDLKCLEEMAVIEFETTEELLNFDVVKKFANKDGFTNFCMANYWLIAVYSDRFDCMIVGNILYPEEIDLPIME